MDDELRSLERAHLESPTEPAARLRFRDACLRAGDLARAPLRPGDFVEVTTTKGKFDARVQAVFTNGRAKVEGMGRAMDLVVRDETRHTGHIRTWIFERSALRLTRPNTRGAEADAAPQEMEAWIDFEVWDQHQRTGDRDSCPF